MKKRNKKRSFTLIELMVVVSIIVILISVLMPALSKAKGAAQKIQCANRIKQLGTQTLMYSDDFNGSVIAYGKVFNVPISAIKVYWHNYIQYYYFNDTKLYTLKNPSLNFICPADSSPHLYQGTVTSYGFNFYIMSGTNSDRVNMRYSELIHPSRTYMISDSNYDARLYIGSGGSILLRLAHNKSTSMFYTDGHIGSLREQAPAVTTDIPWCLK
ncbi:MAG: hypothetical protein A2017_02800 [Lentisphaerae bacterium GWF2_44_16]|nr:MAG: hypothetical protein A2017_02800 [Lentisphaerae bacterium GWF2_44_16]